MNDTIITIALFGSIFIGIFVVQYWLKYEDDLDNIDTFVRNGKKVGEVKEKKGMYNGIN